MILVLLATAFFLACAREDMADSGNGVSLALSLKNVGEIPDAQTKMTTAITQDGSDSRFRGIEQVYVIPFLTESASKVTATSERLGDQNVQIQDPAIGQSGLVASNNSHLYKMVSVPLGTNRVLAYGKAFDSGSISTKEGKHKNGVLNPSGLGNPNTPGAISFSLQGILETEDITALDNTSNHLIAALNDVVEVLQNSEDAGIRAFLDAFTFENHIMACSYHTLYRLYQSILAAISTYSGTDEEAINYINTVLIPKLSALESTLNADNDFPSTYGIPEGSIGMWWNGNRYVKIMDQVNISLVSKTDYCYPPSLWYYINSTIKTADDESVEQHYRPGNVSWGNILYFYNDGTYVTSKTRSVAIEDQLQYGVGLVEFHFNSPGNDAKAARNCPLTGIIIGDQKDVDFSFTPKSSSESRFAFDNNITGEVTLGGTSQYIQMLVLPTASQQTVHFALEFRNNTVSTFQCQQGTIMPGCKFYLAGELNPADGQKPQGKENLNSAFSPDHKTTVWVKVKSLANAYNTVPDLRDPQLVLGVTAEMDWMQVEPGGAKLEF